MSETITLPRSELVLKKGREKKAWIVDLPCAEVLKFYDAGNKSWVSFGWTMLAKGSRAKCLKALDEWVLALRAALGGQP